MIRLFYCWVFITRSNTWFLRRYPHNGQMIKESAIIDSVDGQQVTLVTQRQSTCGQCSANKACGTYAMSKVLGAKRNTVTVQVPVAQLAAKRIAVGEEVEVAIPESAFINGSMALYGIPLVGLIAGALIGELLAGEWLSIVAGLAGLAGGFKLAQWVARRQQHATLCQLKILQ